jgi:hypothetical protein
MQAIIFIIIGILLGWTPLLRAETPLPKGLDLNKYMAVSEVRPGMTGYGLSVFNGTKIERFSVVVLSVLKNFNPQHDVILVRCKGANLEHTGSIAGMSGSPIYLQDSQGHYRMVGAFAYGWPLMKDPVGGVQPIQYMLDIPATTQPTTHSAAKMADPTDETAESDGRMVWSLKDSVLLPGQKEVPADWPFAGWNSGAPNPRLGGMDESTTQLRPLATPLMTSGLSPELLDQIRPVFQAYGLMPLQSGGIAASAAAADDTASARMEPGSVLAVPLLLGDMNLTAIGTVTDVVGTRVFGFGHPFNNEGPISLPMGSGYINGVIANLMTSFKLGALSTIDGTLLHDQTVGVTGQIGRKPTLIPIDFEVDEVGVPKRIYRFQAAAHPRFTPMIAAAAMAAAVNGDHELPQYHTLDYDLTIDFSDGQHIHIANTSANASVQEMFFDIGTPLVAASDNPFQRVMPVKIAGKVRISPTARLAKVLSVNIPKLKYRPGEMLSGYVTYRPFRAEQATMPIHLKLPDDLTDGTYQLIVSDWETHLLTQQQAEPFRFTAENINQVFDVLRDMASIRHNALYLRLLRKADGVAVGRIAMEHLPGSRRQVLLDSGRSDVTPFLNSIVKVIPTRDVMSGSAQFSIKIERNARVETPGATEPAAPAAIPPNAVPIKPDAHPAPPAAKPRPEK